MGDHLERVQQPILKKIAFKLKMGLTVGQDLSIISLIVGVDMKMTAFILMICYLPASKQTKTKLFLRLNLPSSRARVNLIFLESSKT